MKILLITSNATIEKLFILSAEKKGDEVSVGNTENIPDGVFDAVFIDKDLYTKDLFDSLKELFPDAKFVLIVSKHDEKIVGFDDYLTKPFLPTDLIELLERLPNMQQSEKSEDEEIDIESFDELKDLDLSDENELNDMADLELGDDLDFDLDLDDIEPLNDKDEAGLEKELKLDEVTEELETEPLQEEQEIEEIDNIDDMFEDLEKEEDLKDLDAKEEFVSGDEKDFEISEEELEGEAPDDDIEESFELDVNELIDEEDSLEDVKDGVSGSDSDSEEEQSETEQTVLNDEFDIDALINEESKNVEEDEVAEPAAEENAYAGESENTGIGEKTQEPEMRNGNELFDETEEISDLAFEEADAIETDETESSESEEPTDTAAEESIESEAGITEDEGRCSPRADATGDYGTK